MVTAHHIVIVVFVSCYVQVLTAQGCLDSIAKCEFQGVITCTNWTIDRLRSYYDSNSLAMMNGAYMVSDTICGFPSISDNGCLALDHNFVYGINLTLNVEVTFKSTNSLVDIDVNNAGWNSSKIDITRSSLGTSVDFYINISVTGSSSGRLFIDNVQFVRSACSSLATPTLPPPLVPTTTTSTQVTASPTITVSQHNTTLSAPTSMTGTTKAAGPHITTLPLPTTSKALESSSLSQSATPSTASSSNVGTIVGAVLGVIVVLAAAVVAFVVLARRRGMDFWKTCFNKKNHESVQTPNIRLDSLPTAEVLNENDQTLRPNAGIGSSITEQPSSEDYYSEIHERQNSAAGRPSNANAAPQLAPRSGSSDHTYSDTPSRPQYVNAATEHPPPQSDQTYSDTLSRPHYVNASQGRDHAQPGQDYYNVAPTPQNPTGLYESLQNDSRAQQNYEYTSLGQPSTTAARGIYKSLQRGAGTGENYEYTTLGKP